MSGYDRVEMMAQFFETEGERAYQNGVRVGGCPYNPKSRPGMYWLLGWLEAYRADEGSAVY
jgi:ribosome modulation factor